MTESHTSWSKRLTGAGAVAAVAVALVAINSAPASAKPKIPDARGSMAAIADSYIVVFKKDVVSIQGTSALADTLAAKAGAKVEFKYQSALRGFAGSMSASAAKTLAADPSVESVSQNRTVRAYTDQLNPPSWGIDRVDQRDPRPNQKYSYTSTAGNVNAYVIDTGIRTTHTDFGGRATFDFAADGNKTDCHGHGTHVAGTIGGSQYGVAKAVKLHAVKVLDCDGRGTTAQVVAGIDRVTANAVKPAVANMSLGGEADSVLDAAVRNSIDSGITYAIASGNSATDACTASPARVGEALTVNATGIEEENGTLIEYETGFSNYGPCTDLYAPGQDIVSTWNGSDTDSATISGTSMAAPHVAGAAALYLAGHTGATPAQVGTELLLAASPSGVRYGSPNTPNLALYTGPTTDSLRRAEVLSSGQFRKSPNGRNQLIMQSDGNLVLYNQANTPLWHTNTYGNPGARAVLQTDGNFVVYSSTNAPLWHTHTYGTAADRLNVQDDANVVLYGSTGAYYWHRFQ